MAKKKKPTLPPDSKAFIKNLVSFQKDKPISEAEKKNHQENVFLIETYSKIDKMIEQINLSIPVLRATREYDFDFLSGENEKRAWEYCTYVSNHLKAGLSVKMMDMLDKDFVDKDINPVKMAKHIVTEKELSKIVKHCNTLSWQIDHIVNKKPLDNDRTGYLEQLTDEQVAKLKYHNGICVVSTETATAAVNVFTLLKKDALGKIILPVEAHTVKKGYYDLELPSARLMHMSYVAFFYDMYLLLAQKLGATPIDVRKYVYRSRLSHQMARVGVGVNDHVGMMNTLINFWKDNVACLEEIKPHFHKLIEEHSKQQITIIT